MANPDGSMDGWVAEHQERDHPWPRQTTMAWPRRAHVEALTWSAWSADNRTGHLPQETQPYGTIWSQRPPQSRYKLQPDLKKLGAHMESTQSRYKLQPYFSKEDLAASLSTTTWSATSKSFKRYSSSKYENEKMHSSRSVS